jgi:hypothetical protein
MITLLRANKTTTALSSLSLLLILERIFLDFRYVALEMEAPQAFMPFTLPYMVGAFLLIGGWIWALLAASKGSRAALIALAAFSALNLFFALSTMATLCPLPCQTASPITDILVILELVISVAAILSAGLAWWTGRAQLVTSRSAQEG